MNPPQKLCAIDFGSWSTKIAAQTDNHYEIVVNEANFRETPSVVGFSDCERLIGEPGQIKMKSNFHNTLRSPLRLLGLAQRHHIIAEEMKFCTAKHQVINQELKFFPTYAGNQVETEPEEFLTALMTKAKRIVESHNIFSDVHFLAIPSYFNNGERMALKACAEAAQLRNVNLIEEWEAICAEYVFFRQKELAEQVEPRVVIIMDVGYAKFGAHACLVSKNEATLLDQEALRFSGCRNMDRLLIEYYEAMFTQKFGDQIQKNPKALVKLMENVETQRKKLSANKENHLNIECILGDNDLEYNMKREELEHILMPVFGQFATSMQSLKQRVQMSHKLHSVEIIGGGSRTPFFQQIAKNIFQMEISKTLNTSESIARGAAICGAMRLGFLPGRTIHFNRTFHHSIFYCLNALDGEKGLGKRIELYDISAKKKVFSANQAIPANCLEKIKVSGRVELILFCEEEVGNRVLGYLQFTGEDSLAFFMDSDKILRVRLTNKQKFDVYDIGELISVEKSVKLGKRETAMIERDQSFILSYEIRNQLEALLYKTKDNLSSEWKDFTSHEQCQNTAQMISENEEWLSYLKQPNVKEFTNRLEVLQNITDMVEARRKHFWKISGLIKKFKDHYSLYSKAYKGKHEKLIKLNELKEHFDQLEAQEISMCWDGSHLNEQVMTYILEQAEKVKK